MATGATYFFNMAGFNKAAITPDFPAKHMSYILNHTKVQEAGHQHASANYHGAQRWLSGHYQQGRKNARVWTRLILNLPYDLNHRQRVALVKAYLAELSQGRAQFVWAIHGDTAAPHAHVVFVDKDSESGRRVAGLSDAGSAYRWRSVWERCCNHALELAGSVARVSRWGQHSEHHLRLNMEARGRAVRPLDHGGTALSPAEASTALPEPPAPQSPETPRPPAAVPALQTEHVPPIQPVPRDMDVIIKQERESPSIAAVVAFVASQVLELERLRAAKQTIADYRAAYAQVTADLIRTQARMEAIDPELQRAGARVIKVEQEAARHRGLLPALWQLINPAARARAKAAKTAAEMAVYTLSSTRVKANGLLRDAQALQAEQKALHEKAVALKGSLAIYGSDEDVAEAERALIRTIKVNTAELTAVELSQALLAGHITTEEHRTLMRAIERHGLEVQ